jgi:hypothetical protein
MCGSLLASAAAANALKMLSILPEQRVLPKAIKERAEMRVMPVSGAKFELS